MTLGPAAGFPLLAASLRVPSVAGREGFPKRIPWAEVKGVRFASTPYEDLNLHACKLTHLNLGLVFQGEPSGARPLRPNTNEATCCDVLCSFSKILLFLSFHRFPQYK